MLRWCTGFAFSHLPFHSLTDCINCDTSSKARLREFIGDTLTAAGAGGASSERKRREYYEGEDDDEDNHSQLSGVSGDSDHMLTTVRTPAGRCAHCSANVGQWFNGSVQSSTFPYLTSFAASESAALCWTNPVEHAT